MGVHWKIQLLGEGGWGHKKPIEREGVPKKGALDSLQMWGRGWQERRGGMFLRGVDTTMHTMAVS